MFKYGMEKPPKQSDRCTWWIDKIKNKGWRGTHRIIQMKYTDACRYFGLFLWEWFYVIRPMMLAIWEAKK